MADSRRTSVWFGRGIFLATAMLLLFLSLVPLRFTPGVIPRPDLTLSLTLAIVLRRPEFAPVWLVAPVFFLDDIFLGRPLGLWTLIVVLCCEVLRAQEYRFRDLVFPFEWLFVAGVMLLALFANWLILTMTFAAAPGAGLSLLQYFVTVLIYPLVVFFCYSVLRIRKISPDQAIRFGHRL